MDSEQNSRRLPKKIYNKYFLNYFGGGAKDGSPPNFFYEDSFTVKFKQGKDNNNKPSGQHTQ